jgi:hypothetical protein
MNPIIFTGTRQKEKWMKTERMIELFQHETWWVPTIMGYLFNHPTFPYRIKMKFRRGNLPFWATKQSKEANSAYHRTLLLVVRGLTWLMVVVVVLDGVNEAINERAQKDWGMSNLCEDPTPTFSLRRNSTPMNRFMNFCTFFREKMLMAFAQPILKSWSNGISAMQP